ncbi:MAG: PD-(D/E)XK nuclease family protein [Elusimicrobiaceae bacterium]|nr:PD-(D/E)XK nuclease family protein [Elusimicrobiaceae bacterium]
MKLYCGQFRSLERQFAVFLDQTRETPLSPVLIAVPSARMADYLSRRLALGGACANIVFETFSSLSAKVALENFPPKTSLAAARGDGVPPVISAPGFQEFLLRSVLELYPLESGSLTRGFASAVRESVRDLTDALVNDEAVLAQLEDGAFEKWGDTAAVRWLLRVRSAYMAGVERLPALSRFEIAERAIKNAPQSAYLARFDSLAYYGFYELTGVQLEFFNAVRQNFPVTLFYPHEKLHAMRHADRFFDTQLAGYAAEITRLEPEPAALGVAEGCLFSPDGACASVPEKALKAVSVSGAREELKFAAREILELVERENYAFSDIAVVARTLEPYAELLEPVFGEYLVPFRAAVKLPLLASPSARLIKTFLSLRRDNYPAEQVRAVWSSACFNAPGGAFRAARVCGYMAQAGVTRGIEQWRALFDPACAARFSNAQYAAADLQSFAEWLAETDRSLAALERAGSWRALCGAARGLIEKNIVTEPAAAAAALEALDGLELYGLVRAARENEFLDEAAMLLEQAAEPAGGNASCGVDVLDAMGARGRTYRAVIILGLNEKSFPRLIREDPVLRDSARRVLRDTLGYWIAPKLDGYDEERLLFHYLLDSASERVFCVWQATDEEGRAKVMSSFLAELLRACSVSPDDGKFCVCVPRRLSEQFSCVDEKYLSARDFSLKLALSRDAEAGYPAAGLDSGAFKALRAGARAVAAGGAAGGFDGLIGTPQPHLLHLRGKGFSPTSLEDLGKCPLKYFFSRVLGLRGGAEIAQTKPDARETGNFYHAVLCGAYRALAAENFWAAPEPDRAVLCAARFFEELVPERKDGVYPVVWETVREKMHATVKEFVRADVAGTAAALLAPSCFEQPLEAALAELKDYKCAGIADRIDVGAGDGTFLVVDYKTKLRGSRLLKKDVLRAARFQPFLYFLMAEQALPQLRGLKPRGAVFKSLEAFSPDHARGAVEEQSLSASDWNEIHDGACALLRFLAGLAETGNFFINPNEGRGKWCEYCDFARACRKNHHASVRRARMSALFSERDRLTGGASDDES